MLTIYRLFTNFLYPFFVILILLRKFFNKEDPKRLKEKILTSKIKSFKKNRKLLWFHVASIGELQSVIPLIERINSKNKINILLTTVTLTSANLAKKKFKDFDNISHRYFPLDVNFLIKNFLDIWKPDLISFVDSEVWPNFLFEIKKRKIPIILLNARITRKTFLRWNLIPQTAKKIFNIFDVCIVSNKETVSYLRELNAKKIKYIGNLKLSMNQKLKKLNSKKKFKRKMWCALSIHKEEDFLCIKTHSILRKKDNKIKTIIIPRHIDRTRKIGLLCEKEKFKYQIITNNENIKNENEIIIINSYGKVSKFLKLCDSVFIGKSLIKRLENVGGQNPIEAAKLGCKIYHGPYVYNFKDIYKLLLKLKIAEKVNNEYELAKKLISDLESSKTIGKKKLRKLDELGKFILVKTYDEFKNILKK